MLVWLGDGYVRNEFKLHKGSTKDEHLVPFFEAWDRYLVVLKSRTPVMGGQFGSHLDDETQQHLSKDQKAKLEELKKETYDAAKKAI
jgi:hypothetical protein